MNIRIANQQDAKRIREILEKYLIDIHDANTTKDKAQSGFLIRNISLEKIKELILDDKKNLTLVANNEKDVIGYLMATKFLDLPDEMKAGVLPAIVDHKIDDLKKIIYYRQIATDPEIKVPGTGKFLVDELIKQAKLREYKHIICRIVFEPIYNSKSVAFHEKRGFKLIGRETDNNVTVGIYLLTPDS